MSLPLEGYRVVDFGWVAAAPIMGAWLADVGAEVIKVESRTHWDTSRFTPDNATKDYNKDPWFHCLNRGKLGITLNLSHPEAIELAKQLVRKSDIVIENFAPGIMQRFGLDYESLRQIKRDIIMISLSGCGQEGPYSKLSVYGPSLNGLAGVDSLVGYPNDRILGMQQPFSDFNGPIHGLFAVLAALYHRDETGEGDYIDLAQLEALVSVIPEVSIDYVMNGRIAGTTGNRNPTMAPHNNYRCKGKDKWVSIAIKTDEEWQNFCNALGNPRWCFDDRFSSRHARLATLEELDELISRWTIEHTAYEVMEILQAVGVAAIPCMDIEERYFDPHFKEREVFINATDSQGSIFAITNVPYKMSRTPIIIRHGAPLLGEHNEYVFGNILGLSSEKIARLEKEEIIF